MNHARQILKHVTSGRTKFSGFTRISVLEAVVDQAISTNRKERRKVKKIEC